MHEYYTGRRRREAMLQKRAFWLGVILGTSLISLLVGFCVALVTLLRAGYLSW